MGDPIAKRLDSIDRTLKNLAERLAQLERNHDMNVEMRADWESLHHKSLMGVHGDLFGLFDRVKTIENVLFPKAAEDKARLGSILGNRLTPRFNPLDQRKPTRKKDGKSG